MSEWHPPELDLARAGETEADEKLVDHLRWCSRCRAAAGEYEWLEGEISAALHAGLAHVAVPRPNWESQSERLRRRSGHGLRGHLLAVAGVAVMACVSFVAPAVLGRGMPSKGLAVPGRASLPRPGTSSNHGCGTSAPPALTITPIESVRATDQALSLPFVPPPEPPAPEG